MKSEEIPLTFASALENPEEFIVANYNAARARVESSVKDAAAYAQIQPEKALLWALGGGYLLRMLPLTGILRALIQVVLTVLKPAALIYGSAKLWQKVQPFVAPSGSSANR